MQVLLTGSSGFLGKTIVKELSDYSIIKLSRDYSSEIICNLSEAFPILPSVNLVIHAAGKAHSVPKIEAEKQAFFDVNVTGTQNLLKGLERAPTLPQYFVFISSVSVYGVEIGHMILEDAPLLAQDAYGKSKIEAEQIVQDWCCHNNVICTILRLPLLVGRNPPGNLGDMIKGIRNGFYFNIAGGKAKKSMVLAEDVANIIPIVAKIGGIYNLTDRYHPSFYELSGYIAKQLNKSHPINIPLFIANLIAFLGSRIGNRSPFNKKKLNKIISNLTFDDTKAVEVFNWKPTPVIKGFIVDKN